MTDTELTEAEITQRRRTPRNGRPSRTTRDEVVMMPDDEGALPRLPQEAEEDERFVYRWCRVELGGEEDMKNVLRLERAGWVFVKPEDLPGAYKMPIRATGNAKGAVGIDDVALMRLPREIAEARRRWQDKKASDLMQAVDRQLYRENDPRMPIFNESRSSVRVGRNAEFDPS